MSFQQNQLSDSLSVVMKGANQESSKLREKRRGGGGRDHLTPPPQPLEPQAWPPLERSTELCNEDGIKILIKVKRLATRLG